MTSLSMLVQEDCCISMDTACALSQYYDQLLTPPQRPFLSHYIYIVDITTIQLNIIEHTYSLVGPNTKPKNNQQNNEQSKFYQDGRGKTQTRTIHQKNVSIIFRRVEKLHSCVPLRLSHTNQDINSIHVFDNLVDCDEYSRSFA